MGVKRLVSIRFILLLIVSWYDCVDNWEIEIEKYKDEDKVKIVWTEYKEYLHVCKRMMYYII